MAIPLRYNFRSLLVRRVSTLAAVVGVALVVTVFVVVLALAGGFRHAVRTTGSPENAIAIRKGSNAEIQSGIEREAADVVAVRPEIAADSEGPLVVRELVTLMVLPRRDGAPANVVVRGTSERAWAVRPEVLLLEGGRRFRKGLREVVVGQSLARRLQGVEVGRPLHFGRQDWLVVGIFETQGSGFESEVWGDCELLQAAYDRQGVYQSVTFRLADPDPAAFAGLKEELEKDPKLEIDLKTEEGYYAEQSEMTGMMISILGGLVTAIMCVGAVVGAMNTMYAAVGSRAREVATLRALGFGRLAVLISFIAESLILAAMGGVLGCLLSLPLHGLSTGTTNWNTFSELAFSFRITPGMLAGGLAFALIMGGLGGFLPAVRAARLPITRGLRDV